MAKFHYRWKWSLKSDVASLWPYVTNTDRFRAVTGFPAATFTEEPLPEGGSRRIGRFRMYGFPLVWEEQPFEWIRERVMTEAQHYLEGPLKHVKVSIQLEPRAEGGTDLTYEVWAETGNILGYPGIPVQIGLLSRYRFERAFKQIDDYIQTVVKQPFLTERTPISNAGRARLREISTRLIQSGHDPALVSRLIDYIGMAADYQLSRMRAYAFADTWQADRNAVLELFLQATKNGLLDLSWDMICPECRGAKHRAKSLDHVAHKGHCSSCNIDYEVDFARSVEATFQVNPAIKAVVRSEYCIGSPQNTPHILMQQSLAPGESRNFMMPLTAQGYRWRIPRLAAKVNEPRTVQTPDDPTLGRAPFKVKNNIKTTQGTVTIRDRGVEVDSAEIGSGMATLTMKNETNTPQIILLEQTAWSDQASSAAEVTSLQSFRDLFSSEALRPGESISVERLAFLFTDLKGSTMLYQTVGDAPAFRRVMDHFGILREGVSQHQGALVKTIGDAIMAVFSDPVDAIAASLYILEKIHEWNHQGSGDFLVLKMGIHQGACIAVTLNERLDYFGSVVNLSARLEGQSLGDDVVISETVANDPAVIEFIEHNRVNVETFDTTLKGFTESFSLRRLTLAPAPDHVPDQREVVR
jgi:adenylate cyclase